MGCSVRKFKTICPCREDEVYDPGSELPTATSRVICCPKCESPGL